MIVWLDVLALSNLYAMLAIGVGLSGHAGERRTIARKGSAGGRFTPQRGACVQIARKKGAGR